MFITHTHSDHVGDLYQLNLASWVRGRKGPLQVYGTETVQDLVDGYNLGYVLIECIACPSWSRFY
ncbi:MAG: hypothetical protein Ct9H90mP15_09440 [Candidatus Neomarinimicrobiota bacterium]|nr:MAG: hypothetical protein Ct9H90mP15_09440 [Candidatus Neomarinimicrobiota bacterium]